MLQSSLILLLFFISQVSSWGGYVFLINLIPLHVLALMATGRFSHRIYVAYCSVSTSFIVTFISNQGALYCVEINDGILIQFSFVQNIFVSFFKQVYCLGTILSMQISFVGFQPVQSSEHMAVSQVILLCCPCALFIIEYHLKFLKVLALEIGKNP